MSLKEENLPFSGQQYKISSSQNEETTIKSQSSCVVSVAQKRQGQCKNSFPFNQNQNVREMNWWIYFSRIQAHVYPLDLMMALPKGGLHFNALNQEFFMAGIQWITREDLWFTVLRLSMLDQWTSFMFQIQSRHETSISNIFFKTTHFCLHDALWHSQITSCVVLLEVRIQPSGCEFGHTVNIVSSHSCHKLLQVCLKNKQVEKAISCRNWNQVFCK